MPSFLVYFTKFYSGGNEMEIKQVLNNNVVVAANKDNQEVIVMGKGLAFKKKPGDTVDIAQIEKTFVLKDTETTDKLVELMQEVSEEYLDLSYRIIEIARTKLGYKLDDYLYIALTDHLSFAISRHKSGIDLKNPLLWEIRKYYKEEFQIALKGLDIIEENIGVRLADDEAASIALHLVNSQLTGENMESAVQVTQLVDNILTIVKYYFQLGLNENSVSYERFLTHLRFFAIRLVRKEKTNETFDHFLYEQVKQKYKKSFSCAERIALYIAKNYDWQISEDEKVYLTLHIYRVTNRQDISSQK